MTEQSKLDRLRKRCEKLFDELDQAGMRCDHAQLKPYWDRWARACNDYEKAKQEQAK